MSISLKTPSLFVIPNATMVFVFSRITAKLVVCVISTMLAQLATIPAVVMVVSIILKLAMTETIKAVMVAAALARSKMVGNVTMPAGPALTFAVMVVQCLTMRMLAMMVTSSTVMDVTANARSNVVTHAQRAKLQRAFAVSCAVMV